jgi:hypothetical protein
MVVVVMVDVVRIVVVVAGMLKAQKKFVIGMKGL